MKKNTIIFLFALSAIAISIDACKEPEPAEPAEQELITTMKLIVTDGSSSQTFTYKVENGLGSTTGGSTQIDTIKLAPNKTYSVTTELYNEKENPAENITLEVIEERNDHLLLYNSTPASGAGSISFTNGSKDKDGNPFNQTISFTTGDAGSGSLQVNLMHEPTNKAGTTPAASGGETDAEVIYPVRIQ